jgi:large subunit ribosomal protein L16
MRVHNFKYRKVHKVRADSKVLDYKRLCLIHGSYGLRALEGARVTAGQIESCRRAIKKVVKKLGNLWIRVDVNLPVTKKPAEVRMGKGKGAYSHSVGVIKVGTVLFELSGANLSEELAKEAFFQGKKRLPFATEVIFFKQ